MQNTITEEWHGCTFKKVEERYFSEAVLHDRGQMTESEFEFDQKFMSTKNMNS